MGSHVVEQNELFYRHHKAELDNAAQALRMSGQAFLCLACAGLLQQAWDAGGGFFWPTPSLDQVAFGCFLLHAGPPPPAPPTHTPTPARPSRRPVLA